MRRVILPYRDRSGTPGAGVDVDELGVLGDGSGCAPSPDYVYRYIGTLQVQCTRTFLKSRSRWSGGAVAAHGLACFTEMRAD